MKIKLMTLVMAASLFCLLNGCSQESQTEVKKEKKMADNEKSGEAESGLAKITFAGGCFWCMEPPFEVLEGVSTVVSGYMGGEVDNPTYEQICTGTTGHAEVVQVTYDPTKISVEKLLETFWHNIDPTTLNRQFADRGTQYRTAIFYHTEEQKKAAEASKKALAESGKFDAPIVTEITKASKFYPAEDYHQDYYKKNPARYGQYKIGSGRADYIEKTWGKKEEK